MMEDLKKGVIKCLKIMYDNHMLVNSASARMVLKNVNTAEKAKQAGNALFLSSYHDFKVHHRILCCYNESIAYAPSGSEELAIAYGNKSALLLHLRKYAECICEADKALQITKSVALKIKLLCRKAECHTALGSSESSCFMEKAKFLMSKFDGTEKEKETLNNLVRKSELVVSEGKLDIPKEVRRRVQGMKLISEAEESDILDSVSIRYSDRYGIHLTAARDFVPGEIIFVETPYLNMVPDSKAFVYCYHCLKYLWTIVPCDQCAWRAFCSTECKDEACDQYHKMECYPMSRISQTFGFEQYTSVSVIMSFFFKALRESGGDIHRLRADLESIDSCKDESQKISRLDEKISSYKNVFSLPTRNLEGFEFDSCFMSGAIALAGLAQFTQLFNTTYKSSEITKLMKNETAVFVGALMAKYAVIIVSRCSQIALYDPDEKPDWGNLGNGLSMMRLNIDNQTLNALPVVSQLTILNCIPNVMKVHTHGNKAIAFALHPIKRGEQITSTVATVYCGQSKAERQAKYRKLYNRPCDCRACLENWYETPGFEKTQGMRSSGLEALLASEISREWHLISDECGQNESKLHHPDVKLLTKAARLVERSWNHFPLPSTPSVNAISLFMRVAHDFYQPIEEHLEFSEPCKKKV